MKKSLLLLVGFLALSFFGVAQQDYNIRKSHFNLDKSGLALDGFDPISYFENKPSKGKNELFAFHRGVKYLFSSQQHLDEFKKTPDKYEPAYGGWCAYAMGATGEKVEVDPETYKINNGKLYLFYHTVIVNTLTKWNKDEANLKTKADKTWTETTKK